MYYAFLPVLLILYNNVFVCLVYISTILCLCPSTLIVSQPLGFMLGITWNKDEDGLVCAVFTLKGEGVKR